MTLRRSMTPRQCLQRFRSFSSDSVRKKQINQFCFCVFDHVFVVPYYFWPIRLGVLRTMDGLHSDVNSYVRKMFLRHLSRYFLQLLFMFISFNELFSLPGTIIIIITDYIEV